MRINAEFWFEDWRGQLSHAVLQNGILLLLSTPPDLWSAKALSQKERVARLTKSWAALAERPDSFRLAAETWRGKNTLGIDVADAARILYARAHDREDIRPSAAFPSQSTLQNWLSDMEIVLKRNDLLPDDIARLDRELVAKFWTSAITLAEFLAAIQAGSTTFWQYFEERKT